MSVGPIANAARVWLAAALAVVPLVAGACASASAPAAGQAGSRFVERPAPPAGGDRYVIQPGDALTVKFVYHPDHDINEVTVRPDGQLVLPLVGEVKAAELTPEQLAAALVPLYSKNLRDPKIDVSVKTMGKNRVFVGGEVARPGYVDFRPGLTPLQAVIHAGGATPLGTLEDVVLLRRVSDRGEYQATKLNLRTALETGTPTQNPTLGPSDMVFVPLSTIGKLNIWVDQHLIKLNPFRGTFSIVPF